jgi:predicted enzyme involved in methoxymalonyl-ACP biosynthesis
MASYSDRFGPLGKIAVLAGRVTGDGEMDLDAWVLSCRAFSRRIEYAMLNALFERSGVRRLSLRFETTERNGPLREVLGKLAEESFSHLDASAFAERKLPWYMRVEWPNE